jgi:acyl transferase domain-containing protein
MVAILKPQQRGVMLVEAVKRLRVWESQCVDLAYEDGDQRAAIPANEMPQDWHDVHAELTREACYQAARFAGEEHSAARCYMDAPHDPVNSYSIDRVVLAVAIGAFTVKLASYCRNVRLRLERLR